MLIETEPLKILDSISGRVFCDYVTDKVMSPQCFKYLTYTVNLVFIAPTILFRTHYYSVGCILFSINYTYIFPHFQSIIMGNIYPLSLVVYSLQLQTLNTLILHYTGHHVAA